jgi:hypothetical protein
MVVGGACVLVRAIPSIAIAVPEDGRGCYGIGGSSGVTASGFGRSAQDHRAAASLVIQGACGAREAERGASMNARNRSSSRSNVRSVHLADSRSSDATSP